MNEPQLFKIAVSAFVIKDDKLLVLKRGEDETFLPGVWEVPGGGVDQGETIEGGLIREAKEEAGITISVGRLFGYFEYEDGFGQKTLNLNFLCRMDPPSQAVDVSSGEMVEARWTNLEEGDEFPFTSTTMQDACKQALSLSTL